MTELATTQAVEVQVSRVEPGCEIDDIALARTMVAALERRAKELRQELDGKIEAWLTANNVDTLSYTADEQGNRIILRLEHDKSVKCRDVRKAFQTLAGLDLSIVEECLSSSAFKHGAMRKALDAAGCPELWDEIFAVEIKTKLKDGGPAPKRLQAIDTRFIK